MLSSKLFERISLDIEAFTNVSSLLEEFSPQDGANFYSNACDQTSVQWSVTQATTTMYQMKDMDTM